MALNQIQKKYKASKTCRVDRSQTIPRDSKLFSKIYSKPVINSWEAERHGKEAKKERKFQFGKEKRKPSMRWKQPLVKKDANKLAIIECDASTKGLGAVHKQEGRPTSYASRTLTDTEKKYHPLELECLAVIFACSKFDQYIYGKRDLQFISDHRLLESIFK